MMIRFWRCKRLLLVAAQCDEISKFWTILFVVYATEFHINFFLSAKYRTEFVKRLHMITYYWILFSFLIQLLMFFLNFQKQFVLQFIAYYLAWLVANQININKKYLYHSMITLLGIQSQDLSNYLCLDTGIVVMQVGLWSLKVFILINQSTKMAIHSPPTKMICNLNIHQVLG